jgi:hypothetical protein
MKKLASAVAFFACTVSPTLAQQPTAGNLEKLSEFKTTGAPMEIPHIPQTGTKAEAGVEQVCSGPAKANRLKMIPPLTVTAISSDGSGKSAKIEIVAARVMQ